jgi:hypothetical protein
MIPSNSLWDQINLFLFTGWTCRVWLSSTNWCHSRVHGWFLHGRQFSTVVVLCISFITIRKVLYIVHNLLHSLLLTSKGGMWYDCAMHLRLLDSSFYWDIVGNLIKMHLFAATKLTFKVSYHLNYTATSLQEIFADAIPLLILSMDFI